MAAEPVRVTDAPLAHLRWGAGPTRLLLLHGVGGGREAWSACAPALADAGLTVMAADLPGYGLSAAIDPFDLAGMAARVAALVEAGRAGRSVLVGHSMGGMVAQELWARAPGSVQALVLANTSPAFGKPDGAWQQGFLAERFAPLEAGLGMAGLAAQLVPAMLGPAAPSDAAAAAQAMMAGVPEATYRAALRALVAFDRRAWLPSITVPTLVITGQHDRTAPPEVAARMAARIPGAACVLLPGAGHLAPIEQPAAFSRVLLDFLRRFDLI
jgi:pimeloyl-ACP methyl ester carboxylesterase